MVLRAILYVLAVGLVSSCASLTKDEEIISIDSTPRGVNVYDDIKGKPIGKTPMYRKVERESSHLYYFDTDTDQKRWMEFDCMLDGKVVYLGNGVPSMILGITNPWFFALGAGAILYDVFGGDGYDCYESLHVDLSSDVKPKAEDYCPKVLIFPPKYFDEQVSNLIAEKWQEEAKKELKECTVYVSKEDSREIFAYLNIDHVRSIDYYSIKESIRRELGSSTNATHLVFLESTKYKESIRVVPKIFDLHKDVEIISDTLSMGILVEDEKGVIKESKEKEFFIKTFNLVPNAVTFYWTIDDLDDASRTWDYHRWKKGEEQRSLPSYLSSWGFSSIDHPNGFSDWDIAIKLSPAGQTGYQHYKYQLSPYNGADEPDVSESERLDYELETFYALLLMDFGLTFHTPVGALTVSYALGGAYIHNYDSLKKKLNRSVGMSKYSAKYSLFLSRDLFFFVSYDRYIALGTKKFFANDQIRRVGWTATSVGIGWFIPEMRSYIRDML